MRPYCRKWWSNVKARATCRASSTANEIASQSVQSLSVCRARIYFAFCSSEGSTGTTVSPPVSSHSRASPSELPQEQCVAFRFNVVGNEARPPLGRDAQSHGDRACMVRVVGIEQREDGARIPENAAGH